MIFSELKKLVKKFPVAFTKNQKYDRLTRQIIRLYCAGNDNCIDAGAHKGEVLDMFLQYAPGGIHYAFEPVPVLFEQLKKKYADRGNCHIHQVALSSNKSVTPFNYVISNPAYSGIRKRKYDRNFEKDMSIDVQADRLDNIIPDSLKVRFIKIDVEGGEMDVLEGAGRILADHHPLIIFEFGIGGSDYYGTTPQKIYSFFKNYQYQVSLLPDFVAGRPPLSQEMFSEQFHKKKNYYFIAH